MSVTTFKVQLCGEESSLRILRKIKFRERQPLDLLLPHPASSRPVRETYQILPSGKMTRNMFLFCHLDTAFLKCWYPDSAWVFCRAVPYLKMIPPSKLVTSCSIENSPEFKMGLVQVVDLKSTGLHDVKLNASNKLIDAFINPTIFTL